MPFNRRPPQIRDAIGFAVLLFNNWIALTTSLPSAAVITEIVKDQIGVPVTAQSALQILKATNIVGDEIYYLASVEIDSTGASTTVLLDTEVITTTTNVAGSTVIGVPLALEISATLTTTIVPTTAISAVLSTPPTVAFTTVDSNGNQVIDIGQEFVRANGSTFMAVLLNNVSATSVTTVNAQGSTVVQTVAILTAQNGSTVTDTLSFASPASASIAAEDAFVLMVKSDFQQGITGNSATAASQSTNNSLSAISTTESISTAISASLSSRGSKSLAASDVQSDTSPVPSARFLTASSTISQTFATTNNLTAAFQNMNTSSSVLSATESQPNATSASLIGGGVILFAASEAAATNALSALLVAQLPTLTTIPSGMTVETVTSTKCTTAGAMITTTVAGSTTTEIVPRLCAGGFAFFLFGTPKLPQLCKERFSLLGFLLQFICDPRTDNIPVGFDLISFDPDSPDAPGNLADPDDPDNLNNPDDPDNSSDQVPSSSISLPSQSESTILTTAGFSTVVSSGMSLSASITSSSSTVISSGTSSSASNTSSWSTAVSSRTSSNASSEPTGTFVDIFYDLITASVPLPAYASGIPGSGTVVANASLSSLFSMLAVDLDSWMDAYSALSIVDANGTASGRSSETTVNFNCVKTT